MRSILRMTVVAVLTVLALTACNGDKPNEKLLDKDAMVFINVTDGKTTRVVNPDLPDNPAHLSPKELVEKAEAMITDFGGYEGTRFWLGGILDENSWLVKVGKRNIGEYQYKDIENAKFILWGDFIIGTDRETKEPVLVPDFFTCKNVHFVDKEGNIIGYIPQRVFEEGWKKINVAFNAKEYDKVYKLFEEVYTAFPCTPEEWKRLKEEGKN